jgi:hypothetical protein
MTGPGVPPYNQPPYPPPHHLSPYAAPPVPPIPPPGQQYPHQQVYPQQPPFPQPFAQQGYGQPIVIRIEGRGLAGKLAAKIGGRLLVISAEGFAHQDKRGGFRLAWGELRRITITTAFHRKSFQLIAPKLWRVRVVMDAADQGFPQRHPELVSLQGKYGGVGPGSYGLPLGPTHNLVPAIAQAFAAYGGQVFGGVIEEGQVIGFGYL